MAENARPEMEEPGRRISPRIIVQGGATKMYSWIMDSKEEYLAGVKQASRVGYIALMNGETAVAAVEKAVCVLENNKYFNAGKGSSLNNDVEVECDAMIMDGATMNTGAVMAVRHFFNPVSLAREVMDKSDHCALCADGTREFAERDDVAFPVHDPIEHIEAWRHFEATISHENYKEFVKHHFGNTPVECADGDSVSAVAMDINGKLACANSTGGVPGKLKGRVGDVPLVGCGGYANEFGAATSSGHGENLIKMTLAREVVYNMERGQNAQESVENSIQRMTERVGGFGGAIAIDNQGNFGKAFNTELMIWATIVDNSLEYGMGQNELQAEQIE